AANGASSLDAEVYAEFDVTADPSQPDDSVPAATDDNDYSFGRPVIDSVEPGAGPLAGGNTVVITGSGFENPDLTFSKVVFDPSSDESGDLSNAIDGVSATVVSDTEIDVTAPDATPAANGASSLDAEVYAEFDVTADPSQPDDSVPAATDDNDYSFGRPVIDSVEPGAGPLAGGNTVLITGSGFENPDLTFSKVVFDPSSDESGDLSNAIDGVSATV